MIPKRTEVWFRTTFTDDDPAARVAIVSCNDWNMKSANHILCAPVVPYEVGQAATRFDILFAQDGEQWMVRAGVLLDVSRAELLGLDEDILLDSPVVEALDEALRSIIEMDGQKFSPDAPPRQRQACFAELHIEGEGPKPVVILSGSGYASEMNFTLVVGARMTSKVGNNYPFDVEVRGQESPSKVVCSDIYTIPANDLRLRQRRPDPQALGKSDWDEVRIKVLDFLGIPKK